MIFFQIFVKMCDPLRLVSYAYLYTTSREIIKLGEIINSSEIVKIGEIIKLGEIRNLG